MRSRFLCPPRAFWIACGALLGLAALPSSAASVTVVVSGLSDLWLAGRPNGSTLGSDSAPAESPFQVTGLTFIAGNSLTFSNASGTVGGFGGSAGPDGSFLFPPSAANSISGFSGLPAGSLIGVFLDDNVPSGAAPASQVVITSSLSYSPLLRQGFFIGDGLTGTGTGSTQTFVIPTGATRLFLGIGDSPGGFFNNTGSLNVTVSDGLTAGGVPEPGTILTLGIGLLGLWQTRRRFKR